MANFFANVASQSQLDALQRYFSRTPQVSIRFTYMGLLGSGSYGVAVRIREHFPGDRPDRDLVIKQANSEEHKQELRWEIIRIQRIAGGMHIVQPIFVENSPFFDYDFVEAPQVHPTRWPEQRTAYAREGYLLGPMLVLELLPNGPLQNFLYKAASLDVQRWPNRLLWKFFLCLVRACIAMAYPRSLGSDGQRLEVIPPGNVMPSNFTHTDLHAGNVMLGAPDPTQPEHQASRILKLIDFGVWSYARIYNLEYNNPNERGVSENIFSIGKLMLDIMTREPFSFNQWIPHAQIKLPKPGGGTRAVATYASPIMRQPLAPRHAGTDPDLRLLVAQCLAVDAANRPALPDLLNRVQMGAGRLPRDYAARPWGSAEETDEFIGELVDRILHDATP
ncbi:kinase-like domain-containing protein [Apiospora marii]|uniref:Kinase-like domain-containing protein n=1 Tax=Apiospora marii TaxID=335849 RepID=A0ABR1RBW9_9PEZI